MNNMVLPEYKKLIIAARKAMKNSYSPYSKFRVGAAVLTNKGNIYAGTNVENISYGLTICAERAAICNAVSNGEKKFKAVAVISDSAECIPPCGACRQIINEFGRDIDIIMSSFSGKIKVVKIAELIPAAFCIRNLKSK